MIHGTPVLDIKPYIADYDSPRNLMEPLGDFNMQNNQHKPKTVSRTDGKTKSCGQQQLSGCDGPQLYQSTKEKPKCPEDRASDENCLKNDETTKIEQPLPKRRERAMDLGAAPQSHQSLYVAEEQMGPRGLGKTPLEEGTDRRPKSEEGAPITQGNSDSVATQPMPHPCPSRTRTTDSTVPAWVREAPVAPLQVRFTPHAEMDLWRLSSGGESGILGFLVLNEK